MKQFFHIPMLFAYMLLILHSIVPHCHGECENDALNPCVTVVHDDEPALFHLLVSFFTNAVHPALEEEAAFHIYASTSKVSKSVHGDKTIDSYKLSQEEPALPLTSVEIPRIPGKLLPLYCGFWYLDGVTRGPPISA